MRIERVASATGRADSFPRTQLLLDRHAHAPSVSLFELERQTMSVRAKFFVQSITRNPPEAAAAQIAMGAVCRGAANAEWASATPAGSLQMTVRNELAVAQFVEGKEYYLTFEEAEAKPAPGDGHPYTAATTSWGMDCCGICGAVGTWDSGKYVWDGAAQAGHDTTYGAAPIL